MKITMKNKINKYLKIKVKKVKNNITKINKIKLKIIMKFRMICKI